MQTSRTLARISRRSASSDRISLAPLGGAAALTELGKEHIPISIYTYISIYIYVECILCIYIYIHMCIYVLLLAISLLGAPVSGSPDIKIPSIWGL